MLNHPCARRHRPDAACAIRPQALCHRCGTITASEYLVARTGDVLNVCKICKVCRKGRPYVTRKEYQLTTLAPFANTAEGARYDRKP